MDPWSVDATCCAVCAHPTGGDPRATEVQVWWEYAGVGQLFAVHFGCLRAALSQEFPLLDPTRTGAGR